MSYFIRIAQDGSLTKAAGILRIAQPALSRQMRLLEEELGVALFIRTARGMRLTEEGDALRAAAAGPLRELELALQNIRTLPLAMEAKIALGLPPGLSEALAKPLALHLDTHFPTIKLCIVEGITGSLIDWLSRGVVDFALLDETARHERLDEQRLLTLPLVLAGPAHNMPPPGQKIAFADAAKLPLILPSHHLGVRAAVNDAALHAQVKLNIRMEADQPRLIQDLLAGGMGYSILPGYSVRSESKSKQLRIWPIGSPEPAIDILIASRKNTQTGSARMKAIEEAIARVTLDRLAV